MDLILIHFPCVAPWLTLAGMSKETRIWYGVVCSYSCWVHLCPRTRQTSPTNAVRKAKKHALTRGRVSASYDLWAGSERAAPSVGCQRRIRVANENRVSAAMRIGVSNYNAEQVAEVVAEFKEAPAVNQAGRLQMIMSLSLTMFDVSRSNGIWPTTTRPSEHPCEKLAQLLRLRLLRCPGLGAVQIPCLGGQARIVPFLSWVPLATHILCLL